MIVMGIDPSLNNTGIVIARVPNFEVLEAYLVYSREKKSSAKITKGHYYDVPALDMYVRLDEMLPPIIGNLHVDVAVVEKLMMKKNLGFLVELNKLIGWIEHICYSSKIPVLEVNATETKKYVTGKGNASKEDMKKALDAKFGVLWEGKDAEHLYDALATVLASEPLLACLRNSRKSG